MRNLIWLTAVRRGVFGTSRFWMVIAMVLGARKLVQRFAGSGKDAKPSYSEELKPGQALVISNLHGEPRIDARMEA